MNELSVLVTGGAGFIGSHIVEYLLNNDVKYVRILDNLSTGSMENISFLEKFDNTQLVQGDIRDLETCRLACVGINAICHQAAFVSVPNSICNPLTNHSINVDGFLNILTAAKEAGIKRVIYTSTSTVYGDVSCEKNSASGTIVQKEDVIGASPSPYTTSKHMNELYGKLYTDIFGLECIGLRYFNVFGPRQDPNAAYAAVIPKFIEAILSDSKPLIYGDGTYSRDFVYVSDVVQANILALVTTNAKCFGEVFNVGTGRSVSVNELLDQIKKYLNKLECNPLYGPVRPGDIPYTCASIDKISSYLNYKPAVTLEAGLAKTVEYFAEK